MKSKCLIVALLTLLLPVGPAVAQYAAEPIAAPPAGAPSVEPAAGARVHDGMYVRLGLGYGWVHDGADASGGKVVASGTGVPIELSVGYTAWPGLAVGLGIWLSPITKVNLDLPAGALAKYPDERGELYRLGAFADYHPDPTQGLHFQLRAAMSGFGTMDNPTDKILLNTKGAALGAGAGYDIWFADQWSLGLGGEFVGALNTAGGGETHTTIAVLGTVSVLWQ